MSEDVTKFIPNSSSILPIPLFQIAGNTFKINSEISAGNKQKSTSVFNDWRSFGV